MTTYMTDVQCKKCTTLLTFRVHKRLKGSYSGHYYCEACHAREPEQTISDGIMKANKWKTIE